MTAIATTKEQLLATHAESSIAGAGQYLTFVLGGEIYALGILNIKEIIEYGHLTEVPMMPAFVRGVINLRGKVIPLVDLRTRFGLPAALDDDRTCIVVTQVAAPQGGARPYGVLVDGVEEVVQFDAADIEPTPDFGGAIDVRFLTGIAKGSERVTMLVDLDGIWAADCAAIPDPDRPPAALPAPTPHVPR